MSALDHLDGMFAFAIWDDKEQKLFCARDRFGEKPFFYHHVPGEVFAFASEIKSLFAFGAPRQVSNGMPFKYLAYDVVEDLHAKSDTFYEGISKLEAAHYLLIDSRGNLTKSRYWSIPEAGLITESASRMRASVSASCLRNRSGEGCGRMSLSGRVCRAGSTRLRCFARSAKY